MHFPVVRGSSWTRLSSCPLRADSFGVQTGRKLCFSTVAVLDKVDMPVVATTGAMPVIAMTGAFGFTVQKTVKVPQLQCLSMFARSSSTVVDVPVIKQRQLGFHGGLVWGGRAFSAVLTPFFALLRLSRS